MLTTKQVADRLGISVSTLRDYIKAGLLPEPARQVRHWLAPPTRFFTEAEVARYVQILQDAKKGDLARARRKKNEEATEE